MTTVTLPSKEMEELRRRFKKGYTVEPAGDTHFNVLDPEGKKVRTRSGRMMRMPTSPRGGRATLNLEKELLHAGVINGEVQPRKHHEVSPEQKRKMKEARDRAASVRAKRRQETADALYERMVAVVEPLGGFKRRGMQMDMALIGAKLARGKTNNQGRPITPDLLQGSIHRVANRQWIEPVYQEVWVQVAEHFEASADPMTTFFDLVREVRGLPEAIVEDTALDLPEGDWPFRVELVRIPLLIVDHTYQRPADWFFIRKTAASFDERLVGTIDVAQRSRGSAYAILDGQQRFEAMRLVGKTTVWCSVYQGLDHQAEARFFLHKNQDKKAIHPFYTFRARLTAGDEIATKIDKLTKKIGYRISITNSVHNDDNISAIAALEETYKRRTPHGADALTPTLELLRQATYGRRSGQHSNLIRGLGRFFSLYPQDDRPLDWTRLIDMLGPGPEILLGMARERARENNSTVEHHMVRVLVDAYNTGVPRAEKLKPPVLYQKA